MASGKFIWRIVNYSDRRQSERIIYSDVFTIGGCNWRLMVYPKGDGINYLPMYLGVPDKEALPSGWIIDAKYSLTVVNQLWSHDSNTYEIHREFSAQQSTWGFQSLESLTELLDSREGHLVDDTLVVEAEIKVLNVSPPIVVLETFFSNLKKFISDATQGQNSAVPCLNGGLESEAPSLEEAKTAKKPLKECLSDLFKLNIKNSLATSSETPSLAEIGLSSEEKKAIELFWGFLTFEQENSEFELFKFERDQVFSFIKKNYEIYLTKKQRLDDLTKEEEEHKKRMEEAKSSKAKLIVDLEKLMEESEEAKNRYTAQDKKLVEAEEKKTRSTAAWLSLKAHFV